MKVAETVFANAVWINDGEHIINFSAENYPMSALMLRREIEITEGGRFSVCLAGLGFHELFINGSKAGDGFLAPGFSAYDKRVYYNEYDVTPFIKRGRNTIGVLLGNGWYNSNAKDSWSFNHAPWRELPKMLLCLKDGGGKTLAVSDSAWRWSRGGPITFNDLRQGEYYDARLEAPYFTNGFNDGNWKNAVQTAPPGGALYKEKIPPVRVTEEIAPVKITCYDGKFLVDFGVNLAGVIRLNKKGRRGNTLTVRYGERLDTDGRLDTSRLGCYVNTSVFQTDRYTFKGGAAETWSPRFVYHGFRYAEISGAETLEKAEITARFMHTDFKRIGSFTCDNRLFNNIFEIGLRAFRSNYHSIPTDCPHREKNGWTGDAQLSCEQSVKNFNMLSAYKKWIADFADAQRGSGQLPGIIPTGGWGYNWGSGPAWDAALFEIPYQCYMHYGSAAIMRQAYPTAKKYHDYMRSRAVDNLICYGLGDWCAPAIKGFKACDNRLSDSVYYFYITKIFALMAELSGRPDEAAELLLLAGKIRAALLKNYISESGMIDGGNITAHSIMLFYGVTEGAASAKAAKILNDSVISGGYKMNVGILGAKTVLNALSDNGYFNTAVKMLQNTEYPSYGHWIKNGATTMCEDWESSFSLNHHMFSDVLAWMYKNLAGIKPLLPGFKSFSAAPKFTDAVTAVRACYKTPHGKISLSYKKEQTRIMLKITVPKNTECRLELPDRTETLAPGSYKISSNTDSFGNT